MRKATGNFCTLDPEFAVEEPLSKTSALVPEFAEKDLPLGRTLMMMMTISIVSVRNVHQ